MSRMPQLSGQEVVKALCKLGFMVHHHYRSSHIVLRHETLVERRVTVPSHRVIKKGTLKSILRQAGITLEELRTVL
ncbi:MAG TPA: type II toxin-antitoxin system HicA family toxin [Candidatus Kapabacteria bacterium]|nr:type II toxin-antitoxin system HicA family toxin [Candidatus Kapabacteria bacterium]